MNALHASRVRRSIDVGSGDSKQFSHPHRFPIPRLSIAPMVDVTGTPFRLFARIVSRNTVVYTPMIVDRQLLHMNNNTRQRIASYAPLELSGPFTDDRPGVVSTERVAPLVAQISGCNADTLAATAHYLAAQGYPALNINMGCPASSAQNGAHGAVLMLDRRVWAAIGRVRRELAGPRTHTHPAYLDTPQYTLPPVPISIKCRLGVNAPADYAWFRTWALNMLSGSGVEHIIVHGRIAKLGDNTRRNLTVPPLHPHFAAHLRADVQKFMAGEGVRARLFQLLNAWDEEYKCYRCERTGTPYVLVEVDFEEVPQGAPESTASATVAALAPFMRGQRVRAVGVRLASVDEPYLFDVVSRATDRADAHTLATVPGLARVEAEAARVITETTSRSAEAMAGVVAEDAVDCPLVALAPHVRDSLHRLHAHTATTDDLSALSAALLHVLDSPLVPLRATPLNPAYYLSGAPAAPRRHHAPQQVLVEYNGGVGGTREAAEHAWGVAGTLRGETKGNANAGAVVGKGKGGRGHSSIHPAAVVDAAAVESSSAIPRTGREVPDLTPSFAGAVDASSPFSLDPSSSSSQPWTLPPPVLPGVMVGRAAQSHPLFPALYDAQMSALAIAAHELRDMREHKSTLLATPPASHQANQDVAEGGLRPSHTPHMASLLGDGSVPLERVADTGVWLHEDGSWPGQAPTADAVRLGAHAGLSSLPIPMRVRCISACPHPSLPPAFSRLDVLTAYLTQVDEHCFSDDSTARAFTPSLAALVQPPRTHSSPTSSNTTHTAVVGPRSFLSTDGMLPPAGPLLERAMLSEEVLARYGFSLRDPTRVTAALAQLDKVAAFAECVAALEDILVAVDARAAADASQGGDFKRPKSRTQKSSAKDAPVGSAAAACLPDTDRADVADDDASPCSSSSLADLQAALTSGSAVWRSREQVQAVLSQYGYSSVNDFKSRLNTLTSKLSRLANDTAYTHMDLHLRLFTALDVISPLTNLFAGVYNADYWKRICSHALTLARKPDHFAASHRDTLLAASRRNLVSLVAAEELASARARGNEAQLQQHMQSYLHALAAQTAVPLLTRDEFLYNARALRYDNHSFAQMDAEYTRVLARQQGMGRVGVTARTVGVSQQYPVDNPRYETIFAGGAAQESTIPSEPDSSPAPDAHPYVASVQARMDAYRATSNQYVQKHFIAPFVASDTTQTAPDNVSASPPVPLKPFGQLLLHSAVDLEALSLATVSRLCAVHGLDEERLRACPVRAVGQDYSDIDVNGAVPETNVLHTYNPHLPRPGVDTVGAGAAEDAVTASNRRALSAYSASLLTLPQRILSSAEPSSPSPAAHSTRRYRTPLSLDISTHVSNSDLRHRPWLTEALPLLAELEAAAGDSDEAFVAALARMPAPPKLSPNTDAEAAADLCARTTDLSCGLALPRLSAQVLLFVRKLQRALGGGSTEPSHALGYALRPSDAPLRSLMTLRDSHHLSAASREALGNLQATLTYLRDQISIIDARGSGVELELVEGEDRYGRYYSMHIEKSLSHAHHSDVTPSGKFAGCLTSHALRTPVVDYYMQDKLYKDALAVVTSIHSEN